MPSEFRHRVPPQSEPTGIRHEDEEPTTKCLVCGAALRSTATDLPLKVNGRNIVIKRLPVMRCDGCIEHLIADALTVRVDELLSRVDESIDLAIVPFTA